MFRQYRSYIVSAGYLLSTGVFSSFLRLAFTLFLVRAISVDEYGSYQVVMSAIGILTVCSLPGFGTLARQKIARDSIGIFWPAQRYRFLGSVVGAMLLAIYGLSFPETSTRISIVFASVLFPFAYGLVGWKDYYVGTGGFARLSKVDALSNLLIYLPAILAMFLGSESALLILIIVLLMRSIVNLYNSLLVKRSIEAIERIDRGSISYSLKLTAYSLLNDLGNNADKLLLFYLVSPVELALYSAAQAIPEVIKGQLQNLRVILVPSFSRRDTYDSELSRRIWIFSAAFSVFLLFLIIFVIPDLIVLLMGSKYEDAVVACQWMSGTIAIAQVTQLKATYITSKLDSRSVRNYTVTSNIIRLISTATLVPWMGITGAIVSLYMYRISLNIGVSIELRKHVRDKREK